MENGDAIWIPRYYPHQAISLTPRLSVSFPFLDNENSSHEKSFEDRNWVTL
jgi:ribosomal protein L16 Arg81 hydroxylase